MFGRQRQPEDPHAEERKATRKAMTNLEFRLKNLEFTTEYTKHRVECLERGYHWPEVFGDVTARDLEADGEHIAHICFHCTCCRDVWHWNSSGRRMTDSERRAATLKGLREKPCTGGE